ncbi:MAG: class I SAM-dependent methyltransferase [Candidatus Melainabacteria bacterium HGW-Melainabacteria-1]|nr:MAG: class I SAM-dependent methyltransferase [Candidatus Melainabacteria bacterium HGW-Melainabacteria-1]
MNEDRKLDEQTLWQGVKGMLGKQQMDLGYHWSFNLRQDPKRLAFVLSRYKFAAKMACKGVEVLEFGCSEGIGTPILAEFATGYTGIDMDAQAIIDAKTNWEDERCRFIHDDFMGKSYGRFGAIVSLDVVEHIYPEYEEGYWATVHANLADEGIVVIGTPNITSAPYASPASQAGHVNLFDARRLEAAMQRVCHNVFLFGINDEHVHTGYHPMCHFLVVVGCYRRTQLQSPSQEFLA